jgi:hypothetical protein
MEATIKQETKGYSWFRPRNAREAVDTLMQVKSIVALLTETVPSEEQGENLELSEEGSDGLYFLLSFVEETMGDCIELISKEQGETAKKEREKMNG